MNILQINQSDISGGAAIAGYRLHLGLLDQGIDSQLLVSSYQLSDERTHLMPRRYRQESYLGRLSRALSLNFVNYTGAFDIPQQSYFQAADLIHFHNLHSGRFNYLALPQLTQNKPAVWTLHDMWGVTGHCIYSYDCDRWKSGCGNCPYPETYPAIERDVSHWEWRLKKWAFQHSNLTIVAPSRWLANIAKQSLLNPFPVHVIPYGIDTSLYQPLDPELGRAALGIPLNKKVVMFGAQTLKEKRKGGDLLQQALINLPASLKADLVLLMLGDGGEAVATTLGIDTVNMGYISSDRLKCLAYSAADLFVLPTRADNLPVTLQESLACGTPMVSFDIGGVSDLVRPGATGYLAVPENAQNLAQGMIQLLEDDAERRKLAHQCRVIAVAEYDLSRQAKQYIELYEQIL